MGFRHHIQRGTAWTAAALAYFLACPTNLHSTTVSAATTRPALRSPLPTPTTATSPSPRPSPDPSPTYVISPSPLPSPSVVPSTPPPTRKSIFVNGQSTDVSGVDRCPNHNDPGHYHTCKFNDGSSVETYSFSASAPTGQPVDILVSLTSASPLSIALFAPNGAEVPLVRSSAGYSYYAGGAAAGTYTLEVSGTIPKSGDDCGQRISVSTSTIAWTGTLTYTPTNQ